ncbi:MAG: hypothetical protein L0212_07890 [Acidobacteria bacterium]|nr:hypothetical protein [Acidobacteriota bacterium]
MARRKEKKKAFDPAQLARRMARAVVGAPPGERVVPSKKKKEGKHKKRELERELD